MPTKFSSISFGDLRMAFIQNNKTNHLHFTAGKPGDFCCKDTVPIFFLPYLC